MRNRAKELSYLSDQECFDFFVNLTTTMRDVAVERGFEDFIGPCNSLTKIIRRYDKCIETGSARLFPSKLR